MPVNPDRNAALDAIRFSAASMVFFCHLAYYGSISAGEFAGWIEGLKSGVVLFFVLSGYLLYEPFVNRDVDLRVYFVRRATRIAPAYLVALVGATLMTGDTAFLQHPWSYLLFLQNYDRSLWQRFLGVSWTLVLEVMFYVSLPLLAAIIDRRPARLVILGLGSLLLSELALAMRVDLQVLSLYPFAVWVFAIGMLLALRQPKALRSPACVGIGVALMAASAIANAWPTYDVIGATGAALLVGWAVVVHPASGSRLAAGAAAISYSFYLWHETLIQMLRQPLIAAVATVGIASCVYVVVERPAISWGVRISRHRGGTDRQAAISPPINNA